MMEITHTGFRFVVDGNIQPYLVIDGEIHYCDVMHFGWGDYYCTSDAIVCEVVSRMMKEANEVAKKERERYIEQLKEKKYG